MISFADLTWLDQVIFCIALTFVPGRIFSFRIDSLKVEI